jgi:hypothetical protein
MANFLGKSNIHTISQVTQLHGSLLGLLVISFRKVKKEGIQNSREEIVAILTFYCPALIYEK